MVIVKQDYLVSTQISVGEFFGVPKDDAYITLKEPPTRVMFSFERALKSGDNIVIIEAFLDLLPGIIVAHNLMASEDKPLSSAEVVEVIEKKLELFMYIMGEYREKVLFIQGKKSAGK